MRETAFFSIAGGLIGSALLLGASVAFIRLETAVSLIFFASASVMTGIVVHLVTRGKKPLVTLTDSGFQVVNMQGGSARRTLRDMGESR